MRLTRLVPGATVQADLHRLLVPMEAPSQGERYARQLVDLLDKLVPAEAAVDERRSAVGDEEEPQSRIRKRCADPAPRQSGIAQPVASPAVKRLVPGTATVLAVLAAGLAVSACNVVPYAASANGMTISVNDLNSELHTLQSTAAGACLEEVQSPTATPPGEGAGGPGTYSMGYADEVLDNQLAGLLASQYASSKGITLSSSDLATAKTDLESTLDGAISTDVQQAGTSGTTSSCQLSSGAALTGAQLLAGLPSDVASDQIRNQAVDERLLSNGARITDQAIAAYYLANQSLFTLDCVSLIATSTQAEAQQIVTKLEGGANFADLAARARSTRRPRRTAVRSGATSLRPRSSRRSRCRT